MAQYAQLIYLGVIIALFYFLFFRPQLTRQKEQQALIASLTVGDRVITAGGVYGTVREVTGDDVMLEVAPSVLVRVAKSAVTRRLEVEA